MGNRSDLTAERQRTFDAFLDLGLSESAAFDAAVGRDEHEAIASPFEQAVESFGRLGLSESAARDAVAGRGRVTEVQFNRNVEEARRSKGSRTSPSTSSATTTRNVTESASTDPDRVAERAVDRAVTKLNRGGRR